MNHICRIENYKANQYFCFFLNIQDLNTRPSWLLWCCLGDFSFYCVFLLLYTWYSPFYSWWWYIFTHVLIIFITSFSEINFLLFLFVKEFWEHKYIPFRILFNKLLLMAKIYQILYSRKCCHFVSSWRTFCCLGM